MWIFISHHLITITDLNIHWHYICKAYLFPYKSHLLWMMNDAHADEGQNEITFDIFFSFILKCAACIHRYTCSRDANSICSKYIWNLMGFSMETSARLFRCHSDNNNCSLAKCTDFRWILYFIRETFKQSSVTRNWTLNFDLFRRINEGEQSRKLNGFRAHCSQQ